jgi:hypothetical protein
MLFGVVTELFTLGKLEVRDTVSGKPYRERAVESIDQFHVISFLLDIFQFGFDITIAMFIIFPTNRAGDCVVRQTTGVQQFVIFFISDEDRVTELTSELFHNARAPMRDYLNH